MEEYGIGTDATVADHIQKQVWGECRLGRAELCKCGNGVGTDATVADHIQKQAGRVRVWFGLFAPACASGSQRRRAAANAEGKLLFTWLAELTGCSSHLVYRSNPAQQTLLLPRCCSWSVGMR